MIDLFLWCGLFNGAIVFPSNLALDIGKTNAKIQPSLATLVRLAKTINGRNIHVDDIASHFRNRGYDVVESYVGISERPTFEAAQNIANELVKRFESGEIREVQMVYTKFVSAINCEPQLAKMLPFEAEESGAAGIHTEYIYEPDAATVLGHMLPQYLYTTIYAALLQSAASELSSRMNAMSNATDNAEELMSKLDLYYNKVRQAGITNEITEIVGGAEALK